MGVHSWWASRRRLLIRIRNSRIKITHTMQINGPMDIKQIYRYLWLTLLHATIDTLMKYYKDKVVCTRSLETRDSMLSSAQLSSLTREPSRTGQGTQTSDPPIGDGACVVLRDPGVRGREAAQPRSRVSHHAGHWTDVGVLQLYGASHDRVGVRSVARRKGAMAQSTSPRYAGIVLSGRGVRLSQDLCRNHGSRAQDQSQEAVRTDSSIIIEYQPEILMMFDDGFVLHDTMQRQKKEKRRKAMAEYVGNAIDGLNDIQINNLQQSQLARLDELIGMCECARAREVSAPIDLI